MKNRSVVQILSVLLLVLLLCAITPAAFADGENQHGIGQGSIDPYAASAPDSAAASREQMLVDYISCIMAANKAESRDELEACLAESEGLWYAYSDMLRGQWPEEAAAEELSYNEAYAQDPAAAEDPEYMRQQMLAYFLLYMDAAEKEQDPDARRALYVEAQQLWDIYMSMVLAPEDPYAMPQEQTAIVEMDPVELRQQALTYYLLYLDAAKKAADPQVKAELAAEAEELLNIYLDMVYDEAPMMTEGTAPVEMDPEYIREELLYYYLQFVNAARYERDPYAKAELAAEAEKLWKLYIEMVFSGLEGETNAQAEIVTTDPVDLRAELLSYYLLYAQAADEASDPYVKAQLSAEAKELWNTYIYSILLMTDQEMNEGAAQAETDIYLEDAAPDIYLSEPAAEKLPETAVQPVIGMPNPWTETASLEEAEQISGIALRLPAIMPRDFVLKNYRAMKGTIEADYSNGEDTMALRASVDEEGVYLSGDYNKYSKQWEENVKGLGVDCLGDGENANVATYFRGNVAFALTTAAGREGAGLTKNELWTIVLGTQAQPVEEAQSAEIIGGAAEPAETIPAQEQPAEAAEAVEAAPAENNNNYVIHYTYSYTDENGTREQSGTWNVPLSDVCSLDMQTLINELMNGSQEHFAAPAEPEASAEPEIIAEPEITAEPAAPEAAEAPAAPAAPAVVTSTEHALVISDPFVVDAQGKPVRLVRIGETNMGDLCADAYRVQGGADIGMVDSGAICANIKPGEISDNDIQAIFPYGDELCVIEASGQQILDALEWGSRAVPHEFGGFLQVSGLSYEIHDYIPSGCLMDEKEQFAGVAGERRVKNVMVGNKPLDPAATYTVAGPNFLLLENGAGNTAFQGAKLIKEHIKADTQVLVDYIIDNLNGVIGEEYADPYGQGRIVVFEVAPAAGAQETAPAAAQTKKGLDTTAKIKRK